MFSPTSFPEVSVNGAIIPTADITAEAQNHPAPKGKIGTAWKKAARALTIRALMLEQAAEMGLAPEPKELGPGRRETDDEALIRAVLEANITPQSPSPDRIRAIYDAHPERFRTPTLYEPAHILFVAAPEDEAARAEALRHAEAALMVLTDKPDAFTQIARSESDCSSRESGGLLGQVSTGDTVPEFEAALNLLAPGEMRTTPLETQYGIHVVRLLARAEGEVLPFEAVRPRIAENLEKTAWLRAAQAYVGNLMDNADIVGLPVIAAA